jgi:hypothetical protein
MTKTLFTLTLIATLAPCAATQDSRTPPPPTMRDKTSIVAAQTGKEPVMRKHSVYEPPFCPPRTCLYYAGDFSSTDSDSNGLFNINDEGASIEGQVWVGVKPDQDVSVTGATFVQVFVAGGVGTNPTPFVVQLGTKLGQAGKTICSTSGTATESVYIGNESFNMYAYTIKKLSKSCELKKGKTYYVNLLPTFEDNYGYLLNVEDTKPQNHHGWKNDLNHCYFNSEYYGSDYVTCNSLGIGIRGFTAMEIALTGKETK